MTKKRNRIISAILTLTIAFGLFTWAYPMSAEETTLTDAEIQELVERSKLDKGDKYDDNIFTFEIQNLESINATLKAAAEADKLYTYFVAGSSYSNYSIASWKTVRGIN